MADNNKKPEDDKTKKPTEEENEQSEEDIKLKEELDLLASRAMDADAGIQKTALEAIAVRVKESLGTMTNIPKPLKFLKEHYDPLKQAYEKATGENKSHLADLLSVLGMIMTETDPGASLRYRLLGTKDIASWGHEYIRSLCGELAPAWLECTEQGKDTEHLVPLITDIVTYHMAHSAESEAVDLLLEVEKLAEMLPEHIGESNWQRVALYLLSCSLYLPPEDASEVRRVCVNMLRSHGQLTEALRVAMMLNDPALALEIFEQATDPLARKQMALMLGSQQMYLEVDDEDLANLMNNEHLSSNFLSLARELDVLEPKAPDAVFKTAGDSAPAVDSARMNLASTLVNAFVNAGFGNDKLMQVASSQGQGDWVYKNKEHGMLSAVASVGMIMMWDVDNGLSSLDRYMYTNNENITAGALLGCGLVTANVRNECDPALALLSDKLDDKSNTIRSCALLGLGIAYAGSKREDVVELLQPVIQDPSVAMEVACVGALSLGLVCTASADGDIAEALLQCIMERAESGADLKHALTPLMCLSIGLLYLGKGEAAESIIEACQALDESISEFCVVIVQTCAFATSGDVLQIQKLLAIAGQHPPQSEDEDKDEQEKKKEDPQFTRAVSMAVVGLGAVAMGEEIGTQMATRLTNSLIQFGEPAAKRAVPLCLALLSTSNAEYRVEVTESLHKLSHDPDAETSMCAIFSLGLVGAGTNNSRIADTLRQLAQYYERESSHLFVVRLAQGLLHMGKGLVSLSPFHSDRGLLRPTALAGLMCISVCALDFKNIILQKYQWLLYTLSLAMHPHMLVCLDQEMNPVTVTVRVGQAVDTVGQAGRPKTITAFQTHTTPVLIRHGERAELANDDYEAVSSTLEGFVIVKENEQKEKEEEAKK